MKALRRILLVLGAVAAIAGVTILLLPYDTEVASPVIAGQFDLVVDVPCKAPLVDLVTGEPEDAWVNYAPNRGVVYESDDRAGGAFCAATMQTRGTVGFSALLAALLLTGAAVGLGRRPSSDEDAAAQDAGDEVPDPEDTTEATAAAAEPSD